MKGFLFDENLPQNIGFSPMLPVSHARSLSASAADSMLWRHARENELVIVSKDADFSHRMMLFATALGAASAIRQFAPTGFPRFAGAIVAGD